MPATRKAADPFDLAAALLGAFDINQRINEYMIRAVPEPAWNAPRAVGKGRTIAATFAHLQNVRVMWLEVIQKGPAAAEEQTGPGKLTGEELTQDQVVEALDDSAAVLRDVLRSAFTGDGRIRSFKPDSAAFFSYLLAHDAHHRGQVALIAKEMGHALPGKVLYGLWEWGVR